MIQSVVLKETLNQGRKGLWDGNVCFCRLYALLALIPPSPMVPKTIKRKGAPINQRLPLLADEYGRGTPVLTTLEYTPAL